MLSLGSERRIYLCTGHADMRKGINGLSILALSVISDQSLTEAIFVFRGKSADKIKIIWWDGQGFCMFYKCFDRGKFIWPKVNDRLSIGITKAQLSMLIEGIDWRNPRWSEAPKYAG